MMARTDAQKLRKNELRIKKRAEIKAAQRSTPREGAREAVVSKLVSSAIKKVVQKAKARARTQRWKLDNPTRGRQKDKDYYVANKAAASSVGVSYKDWRVARKDSRSSKPPYDANRRNKERKATDMEFLAVTRLRTRLGEFMKLSNGTKAAGTISLVGCSKAHLVRHLESQIPSGTSLKDYSIDHIFPMSMYKMDDPAEQRRCMNYTNLQPMKLYGIGGNVSWGKTPPSLQLAQRVSRDCWPASISESDLD
jgi:hypothetical protein